MPIPGRSEVYRIPRVGKIHLGVKQSNGRSEYPRAVDYFVVKEDDTTSKAAADAFLKQYGPQPKEINVAFPHDEPERFFPQYLYSYRGGNGNYRLFCKGDGTTAQRSDGKGGTVEMPCEYENCPIYQQGQCKELAKLQFFLPDVPGLGVWQIDTTSFHSTVNLNSSIQMVRALTGGRIKMIPLKLRVVPQVVNPDGRSKTVYVLQLGIDDIRLTDFLNKMPMLSAAAPSPVVAEIPDDEVETDLFIDSNIVPDDRTVTSTESHDEEQSSTEPRSADESETKAVVIDFDIREIKGQKGECAQVRLSTPEGDIITAITADKAMIDRVRTLHEGAMVDYEVQPSQKWKNKIELLGFEVA